MEYSDLDDKNILVIGDEKVFGSIINLFGGIYDSEKKGYIVPKTYKNMIHSVNKIITMKEQKKSRKSQKKYRREVSDEDEDDNDEEEDEEDEEEEKDENIDTEQNITEQNINIERVIDTETLGEIDIKDEIFTEGIIVSEDEEDNSYEKKIARFKNSVLRFELEYIKK